MFAIPSTAVLIFAALAWTLYQFSLSHAIATTILFIFLNIKANREEAWLSQKYPEYTEYQGRVKKLIPGAY
uniref:Methyltransferase family protein n=1 Tax=Desertifilum tharense IPPAS B-1220 TaxID=1781255 RepID=A0ACD5GYI5_9CYAN